jgi:hypothetical protein
MERQGLTRQCPHCRATILASAAVCPGCRGHLRFGAQSAPAAKSAETVTAFRLEGVFGNGGAAGKREFSVVVAVHNERGELIARQVVGVGALGPLDSRSLSVWVEMNPGN